MKSLKTCRGIFTIFLEGKRIPDSKTTTSTWQKPVDLSFQSIMSEVRARSPSNTKTTFTIFTRYPLVSSREPTSGENIV